VSDRLTNRVTILDILRASLQDSNPQVQAEAALSLAKFGESAVDSLIDTLQNPHPNVRQNAAQALGEIRSDRAVESLINALQDPDEGVRYSAAEALGKIGDIQSATILSISLKDPAAIVRQKTAIALSHLPNTSATTLALIDSLSDPDPEVGASVAAALAKISPPVIKPQLFNLIRNSDRNIRRNTALTLGNLSGDDAISSLIELSQKDPDAYVRKGAVTALGKAALSLVPGA
jgi:HEAT repeat protein